MQKIHRAILSIEGLNCAATALEIEDTLKAYPGVLEAVVNFASEKVSIEYNASLVSLFELGKKIEEKGLTLVFRRESKPVPRFQRALVRLVTALVFVVPVVVLMLFEMVGRPLWLSTVWILLLSAPVVFVIGSNIFWYALKSLLRLRASTDVLMAIGMLAAFATGIFKLMGFRVENYAGVAAMIMTVHLAGKYLDLYARGQIFSPLLGFEELGTKEAHLIVEHGLRDLPAEDLRLGDILLVKPGEKIPIDAEILEGISSVDESLFTGSPMPLLKKAGDSVIGGTVNKEGFLKIKVSKVWEETFLAQVVKLVENCQTEKLPIQGLVDRFTNFFVPFVLLLAITTFCLWYRFPKFFISIVVAARNYFPLLHPERDIFSLAIFAAVAVLVIACPAALGLATPTALLMGSAVGARNGVLIRKGDAIQKLRKVKTIIFGKTGTLTNGKPVVTDIVINPRFNFTPESVLFYAASLEAASEHPLARAIIEKALSLGVRVEKPAGFEGTPGKGLRGRVGDKYVIIGNQKQMVAFGIQADALKGALEKLNEEGKTSILVSVDSEVIGILALDDTLKPRAQAVIATLKNMGMKTIMLTGDHKLTAERIARSCGIEEVIAEVLPADKAEVIKKLQVHGQRVAMVGDSINDAPALTQADVGIALGSGTDIAVGAGDMVLVSEDLSTIISAIKISRKTFAAIAHNLFWALFYNVLSLPLAVFGLLHPALAAAAMVLSSLNVILNSLGLQRVNIRVQP